MSSRILESEAPGAGSAVDPAVLEAAVGWYVTFASGEVDAETRRALQRWRAAHPEHERAWQRLQGLGDELRRAGRSVPAPLARETLDAAGQVQLSRRRALKGLAGLGAVGLGAWLGREQLPAWSYLADQRTGVGERRRVVLADGTELHLNSATAVDVDLQPRWRRITLHHGEILVRTGADPHGRPLEVQARDGVIRPLGTRFNVRRYDDESRTAVAVLSGRVRLLPAERPGADTLVDAGRQTLLGPRFVSADEPLAPGAGSWTDGLLTAQRMPLAELLQVLSRHRHGVLRWDPVVAQLRVTGTYPLDDTERALRALASSLPVRLRRFTRFWVSVEPR